MAAVSKLKEGNLQIYSAGETDISPLVNENGRWQDVYATLSSDSTFCLNKDSQPILSILLKNVAPYICVGLLTDQLPVRRPKLEDGVSIYRLVAVGMDPRAEEVHWLLFPTESDVE
jgi:hypothetical protein